MINKQKLVIVSSYLRPCGIAQYVEHLEEPLRILGDFDIEILSIPVDIFRSSTRRSRDISEKKINEMLNVIREADVVNIQLEPGLYGFDPRTIWSRINKLVNASKKIVITYHTVPTFKNQKIDFSLSGVKEFLRSYRGNYVFNRLFSKIIKNQEKFVHIVQTKREKNNFVMFGIDEEKIFDSPLSFLSNVQLESYQKNSDDYRANLYNKFSLSEDAVLIGCFGFLSPYKGIEVAIKAMNILPNNYHLLIVGGLHPEAIKNGVINQEYISLLLNEIDAFGETTSESGMKEGMKRIHFMGAPDNEDFNKIMSICDAAVLPYAEVGQTSSGPAAIALDMNKPIYCSRNNCFKELEKYSKGMLSFFEIGNYVELAQNIKNNDANEVPKIKARVNFREKYNVNNRAGLYVSAFNKLTEKK